MCITLGQEMEILNYNIVFKLTNNSLHINYLTRIDWVISQVNRNVQLLKYTRLGDLKLHELLLRLLEDGQGDNAIAMLLTCPPIDEPHGH